MARTIPLPSYATLPRVILFHREHPEEQEVVLQIPNEDRTDSATYWLDLENQLHRAWISGLKRSRWLWPVLDYAQHIAYDPSTGEFKEIADLDERPEMAKILGKARSQASANAEQDRLWGRGRQRQVPARSQFRSWLMGTGGRR